MKPEDIISAIERITGLQTGAIVGKRRTAKVSDAKRMATALIRQTFPYLSLCQTARLMGRKDHGTVLHHECVHRDLMEVDSSYRLLYEKIKAHCE